MAETNPSTNIHQDVYDEEFFNNLQLARSLMPKIPTEAERNICKKWIVKLCGLKSNEPHVKRNRNHFFRYMLHIMNKGTWTAENLDPHHGFPQHNIKFGEEEECKEFLSRWSGDKKTYVATKPIPGKGALIYMAVSQDPQMGWDCQGSQS